MSDSSQMLKDKYHITPLKCDPQQIGDGVSGASPEKENYQEEQSVKPGSESEGGRASARKSKVGRRWGSLGKQREGGIRPCSRPCPHRLPSPPRPSRPGRTVGFTDANARPFWKPPCGWARNGTSGSAGALRPATLTRNVNHHGLCLLAWGKGI